MLSSLDLFSGIGGITHALSGLAKPVAYCDWADAPRAALASLMSRKLIPRAPISDDVRTLDAAFFKDKKVDIIVGGFPCVGFSGLGLRRGLQDDESGLFREILRMADITRAPLLFLENVPGVVKLAMGDIVDALTTKRGYELRWAISSAEGMGAPHRRSRWFCLAVKPGFEWTFGGASKYEPYDWSREPPRAKFPKEAGDDDRRGMLGNSVVPDAVRYAFLYLASRCNRVPTSLSTPRGLVFVPAAAAAAPPKKKQTVEVAYPVQGIVRVDMELERVEALPHFREPVPRVLVFDPSKYVATKPQSALITTELLRRPETRHAWSTPRHSMPLTNYLTRRSVGDLPTQVRFEVKTPQRLRRGVVSPEFVEYLMGYQLSWTLNST